MTASAFPAMVRTASHGASGKCAGGLRGPREGIMTTQRRATPARGRAGNSPTRGRRLALVLLGIIVLAGAGTWMLLSKRQPITTAEFHGGARLAVDKELIDFGAVKYNQRVRASFRLRNVGDRVLQLPSTPPVDVVEGC